MGYAYNHKKVVKELMEKYKCKTAQQLAFKAFISNNN